MPFVPVSNAAEVVFFIRQDGQELRHVAHFTCTTPPYTGPELEDLLDRLELWAANWIVTVVTGVVMYAISAKALNVENGPQRIRAVNFEGQFTGNPEPNNVTLAVKKITGLAGRSFRGRWYHVGIRENDTAGNTAVPSLITALETLYNQLNTLTGSFVHHLAVVSRFANGVPRIVGIATEVIDHVADPTLDSQRRRLPGRGA